MIGTTTEAFDIQPVQTIEPANGLVALTFQSGLVAKLAPEHPERDLILREAEASLRQGRPVGVLVNGDGRLLELSAAHETGVRSVQEEDENRLAVWFWVYSPVCYLTRDHPEFERIRQTLERAITTDGRVWLANHMRLEEGESEVWWKILDVRPQEPLAKRDGGSSMTNATTHLRRVLSRATEIIADEVSNCASMSVVYPDIGDLHPALCREAHIQSLLFAGLRASGYFTLAEGSYFAPPTPSRRIDLTVWLPDVAQWLFLEIEPCGTQAGYQAVVWDAKKLITDNPTDRCDQLRALLVYGFRTRTSHRDDFQDKYKKMSKDLITEGFSEVGINIRTLDGDAFTYVQAGLWVLGLVGPPHAQSV